MTLTKTLKKSRGMQKNVQQRGLYPGGKATYEKFAGNTEVELLIDGYRTKKTVKTQKELHLKVTVAMGVKLGLTKFKEFLRRFNREVEERQEANGIDEAEKVEATQAKETTEVEPSTNMMEVDDGSDIQLLIYHFDVGVSNAVRNVLKMPTSLDPSFYRSPKGKGALQHGIPVKEILGVEQTSGDYFVRLEDETYEEVPESVLLSKENEKLISFLKKQVWDLYEKAEMDGE